MKLYELSNAYTELLELQEKDEFLDTLEALQDAAEVKLENIQKMYMTLQAEAKAIKEEEVRLASLRKSKESQIESLKSYTHLHMKRLNITKFESTVGKINVRLNPVKLDIEDKAKVPSEFLKVKEPDVDKTLLKKHILENGLNPKDFGVTITRTESINFK